MKNKVARFLCVPVILASLIPALGFACTIYKGSWSGGEERVGRIKSSGIIYEGSWSGGEDRIARINSSGVVYEGSWSGGEDRVARVSGACTAHQKLAGYWLVVKSDLF